MFLVCMSVRGGFGGRRRGWQTNAFQSVTDFTFFPFFFLPAVDKSRESGESWCVFRHARVCVCECVGQGVRTDSEGRNSHVS